jgi:hypothetical protein
MSLFSSIKDLFEIRKTRIETKKARLEVKKLEAEERLVKTADFEQVKEFEPKVRELLARGHRYPDLSRRMRLSWFFWFIIWVLVLAMMLFLVRK